MERKKKNAIATFNPYVYEFPWFSKGKILHSVLVFEEQECNSPRFCLAATHPTNEKMPTFKASCIFKFLQWSVRGRARVGLQLMDFLNVFRIFHSVCWLCLRGNVPRHSDHAALLAECCVARIQLRLVLISLPGYWNYSVLD